MVLLVITSYYTVPVLTCVHQLLTLKTCQMYNVFGSGANHVIYAQFIAQTSAANNGRKIGLLHMTLKTTNFGNVCMFFFALSTLHFEHCNTVIAICL